MGYARQGSGTSAQHGDGEALQRGRGGLRWRVAGDGADATGTAHAAKADDVGDNEERRRTVMITEPRPNLFLVKRTSSWDYVRPCDEAMEITVQMVEAWPRKWFDHREEEIREQWLQKGTNHREDGEYCKRDMGIETRYAIELNSIEELQAFILRYNEEVIVSRHTADTGFPYPEEHWYIEIYDGYRE